MNFSVCTGSVQSASIVYAITNLKVRDLRHDIDNYIRSVPAKYSRLTNCGVASLAYFGVNWIDGEGLYFNH
jgi:hypothetical protein